MPGVVSPHELLQKLQLVQQEQSLTSHDSPRLCPGLAPRFLGPTQGQAAVSAPNQTATTAGQKAAMQFQVRAVNSCQQLFFDLFTIYVIFFFFLVFAGNNY